jgi:hypothetical protein
MESWAANTLRTLAIILLAGLVLVSSLLLLLLSLCAYGGGFSGYKHPNQGFAYLVGAFAVIGLGVVVIARLSRGIARASMQLAGAEGTAPLAAETPPTSIAVALHLSSRGRKAVEDLALALGAQVILSTAIWLLNQHYFWSKPAVLRPHNWVLLLLLPFILYQLPYAVLIYAILKKPDRRAFTYSVSLPAVLILQSLFSLSVVSYYYVHHPLGIILLAIPWFINILILVMAYKAIQQVGLHPRPSSLMVAAVVCWMYFSLIHLGTPFLYRFLSIYR